MLDSFFYAFNVISPTLLCMLLGYAARQWGYFDQAMLRRLNRFVFNFGLPTIMFCGVYSLNSLREVQLGLMGVVLLSLVVLTGLGWLAGILLADKRSERGVIMQGTFRSNYAVVGAALAASLGGPAGEMLSASLQAPTVIYFNVMGVVCLTVYSEDRDRKVDPISLLWSILKNPLILAQLSALACLCVRLFLPTGADGQPVFTLAGTFPWLFTFLNNLSKMASPLVLILLGAQIDFSKVGGFRRQLIGGVALRLVIAPVVGFAMIFAARRLGWITLTPTAMGALLALYGSPAPAAGGMMAEQMNCAGELGQQHVIVSTALSMLSLFVWILLFRTTGLL